MNEETIRNVPISRIGEVLKHDRAHSLYMNTIGPTHREWFIDFANNNFKGNYGMALQYLIDEHCKFKKIPCPKVLETITEESQ